jgi:dephospho-CoA kinase
MLPQIIGLVGPIRAGKTTVSSYLARRYGYHLASNSELLRLIAINLEIDPTRSNLKRLGDAIFSVLGNETLAKYRIGKTEEFPIIVDGIRYVEEVRAYAEVSSFRLLGVTADDQQRYQRTIALAHQGKDLDITPNAFDLLSGARSEESIPMLLKMADHVIKNDGSMESLENAIESIMEFWAKAGPDKD